MIRALSASAAYASQIAGIAIDAVAGDGGPQPESRLAEFSRTLKLGDFLDIDDDLGLLPAGADLVDQIGPAREGPCRTVML